MPLQLKLPIAIRPPRPTIRDGVVSLRIAERLVREVNLDEFYWTAAELSDRVWDVQQEIMRHGNVPTVFHRLYRKQPFSTCEQRGRVTHPYGWDGIDEQCRTVGDDIAFDELAKAVKAWKERYL